MIRLLRTNSGFFIPFLLFMAFGAVWISLESKESIHLYINSFHSGLADAVMPVATWLGDGWVASGVCLIALLLHVRSGLLLIFTNLISSGITQSLKHFVFDDYLRPFAYFSGNDKLRLVPGEEMYSMFSFPSGHTTIAFALFACFAFMVRQQGLKFLFFAIALFAAYTRVYLSQHFFHDIYAGTAIGTVSALFVAMMLSWYKNRYNPSWLERSPLIPR